MEDDCYKFYSNFTERLHKIKKYLDSNDNWYIFLGGTFKTENFYVKKKLFMKMKICLKWDMDIVRIQLFIIIIHMIKLLMLKLMNQYIMFGQNYLMQLYQCHLQQHNWMIIVILVKKLKIHLEKKLKLPMEDYLNIQKK